MKKSLFIIVFMSLFFTMNGQKFVRNGVFVEFGGAAKYYSINYEHHFLKTNAQNVVVGIGGSFMKDNLGGGYEKYYAIPFRLSYLHRLKRNILFEGGVFLTSINEKYSYHPGLGCQTNCQNQEYSTSGKSYGLRLGFRIQPSEKGFFFNLIGQVQDSDLSESAFFEELNWFWMSCSVGYVF